MNPSDTNNNNNNNKSLLQIIHKKQTAICLSLDVDTWSVARNILHACAPYICMVKVHCDLFADWSDSCATELFDMAQEYEFLIMQDSKLSDVPKIVYKQLTEPPFRIAKWADYVTIQPLNYLDVCEYLEGQVGNCTDFPIALVCVAEMNTQNSFSKNPEYLAIVRDLVCKNREQIPAIVSQAAFAEYDLGPPSECIRITPGVCIEQCESGARYRTIEAAITRDKNHVVIIGESLINKYKKLIANPVEYNETMLRLARHSYACFAATHGF